MNIDFNSLLVSFVVFVIAITVHEFGHAFAADRLGDNTPRANGRISLNPIDHLDPLGTIMMLVTQITSVGIGWGRPVLYNPANLAHPRRDSVIIAIAGPITNLLQACVFAGVSRINAVHTLYQPGSMTDIFVFQGVWLNCALLFFNMIPVPPLDGSKVLAGILPAPQAIAYDRFMAQFGLIFFALIALGRLSTYIISPEVNSLYNLLTGQP